MKNVEELRASLAQTFVELRTGQVDTKTASELSNLAGKMIGTVKVQLEYSALRKEAPEIEFMKQ